MLFFRAVYCAGEQRDMARLFGPLQTHPAYGTVDGLPEVMLLESTEAKPSKIEVWHSDMTFVSIRLQSLSLGELLFPRWAGTPCLPA